MNNGIYRYILEEEFGDKKELIIEAFIPEESINEGNINTNTDKYSFHVAGKELLKHNPRIKIMKGRTNCGTIPVYLDKDLSVSELENDDNCKIESEGKSLKTQAIAFAVYAREEIIDYYNNACEENLDNLDNKYDEFIKQAGNSKATNNKFKKIANEERNKRLK